MMRYLLPHTVPKLLLLLSLVFSAEAAYGGHDVFTSLSELHTLWQDDVKVVSRMKEALNGLEQMQKLFKKYIVSHQRAGLHLEEPNVSRLGHPLNSYFLVKHVALGWNQMRKNLFKLHNETKEIIDELVNREQVSKLPDLGDVEGAAFGLARLHSLYQLNSSALITEGVVHALIEDGFEAKSKTSNARLDAWDLALVGKMGQSNGIYDVMVDFFRMALEKHRNSRKQLWRSDEKSEKKLEENAKEENKDDRMMKDDDNKELWELPGAEDLEQLEVTVRQAVKLHDELLKRRGSRFGVGHRTHALPADPETRKQSKSKVFRLKSPLLRNESQAIRHYREDWPQGTLSANVQRERLCAGQQFKGSMRFTGKERCFFAHANSYWLRLAPFRVEVRHTEPYLAVIKDVLYEHECDNVTAFLAPYLNFPPRNMNPKSKKNDWTMKNVWPIEEHNANLARMTRRVEHITGTRASSQLNQSDAFMCGNYGIGGHYGTHPDFYPYSEAGFQDPTQQGNRIATVMTVFEAPQAGGATVWPFLGVSIFPEKGSAAFWFNTKASGHPDYLTLHAACPVLLGNKWIGNKWIRYNPQVGLRSCGLNQEERLVGPLH